MQARLYGLKSTGGKIELLVERIENDKIFLAQVKSSKPLKKSHFNGFVAATVSLTAA